MAGLNHSTFRVLSDALLRIHAPDEREAFLQRLSAALRTVFPSCNIGVDHADAKPPAPSLHPASLAPLKIGGPASSASAIQQLHRSSSNHGADPTRSVSGTRATPPRMALRSGVDGRQQMTIYVGSQWSGNQGVLRCTIERRTGAFSSEERFLFQLIAPHVAQAWHAAAVRRSESVTASPPAMSPLEANHRLLGRVEDPTAPSLNRLIALGLTPREAEVMIWVSKGKTSSEVAVILNSTTGTVNKHLEHIFAKLNVETRTAAAAIVLDALR